MSVPTKKFNAVTVLKTTVTVSCNLIGHKRNLSACRFTDHIVGDISNAVSLFKFPLQCEDWLMLVAAEWVFRKQQCRCSYTVIRRASWPGGVMGWLQPSLFIDASYKVLFPVVKQIQITLKMLTVVGKQHTIIQKTIEEWEENQSFMSLQVIGSQPEESRFRGIPLCPVPSASVQYEARAICLLQGVVQELQWQTKLKGHANGTLY